MGVSLEVPNLGPGDNQVDLHTIDWHARQALRHIQPDALNRPAVVDVSALLRDCTLLGVTVRSASFHVMDGAEGLYLPEDMVILLREDHWNALSCGGSGLWRAKSTLAHELGHHVLHDDPRSTNEEEDAWAFAGCFMMPCDAVAHLDNLEHTAVAETFDVSPQFALAHLKRMKRARMI